MKSQTVTFGAIEVKLSIEQERRSDGRIQCNELNLMSPGAGISELSDDIPTSVTLSTKEVSIGSAGDFCSIPLYSVSTRFLLG
jgi:hypothetical protein